jgi:proline iminopeptidase
MQKSASKMRAVQHLYPPIEPYDQRVLDVGDGHRVYVEQCGNPAGVPVVVLHGGPGGGCSPAMRRYFDPSVYRVVLFDQRGCGRSRPHASAEANTTWHLVADIERIRETLGIGKWVVFGGSWGATLSLVYAQAHPARAAWLVLRGVFLMTRAELDWFYGGGAALFWPDEWAEFLRPIPADERGDLIAAYHRRLFGEDRTEQTRCARAWVTWENALAALEPEPHMGESPADYARAFARLENHYFLNAGFLERDGQILQDMARIAHIPGTIVQGRYDMICPPASARRLARAWPRAQLRMVPNAGHALSEPGISAELVRTMDALRHRLAAQCD